MRITVYEYSALNVNLVEYLDGESANWEKKHTDESYCFYILSGIKNTQYSDGHIKSYTKDGILNPNTPIPGVYATKTTVTGNTSWICLTRNGSGERNISLQQIIDTFILPKGTAFVVLEGSCTADNLQANQLDFFRARDADLTITGNAVLALVT